MEEEEADERGGGSKGLHIPWLQTWASHTSISSTGHLSVGGTVLFEPAPSGAPPVPSSVYP